MHESNYQFYVIGAGLPRTGTLSLKVALEKLLPGKCMHMTNVWLGNMHEQLDDVFDETKCTDESYINYFKRHNIVAAVDVPFIFQYKRAMRLFPDAKVILTVREPSAWVKSMEQTVFRMNVRPSNFEKFLGYFLSTLVPSTYRFRLFYTNAPLFKGALESIGNGEGEKFYVDWVNSVKKYVHPERLLIFNVKEGWKPVCSFLNLPIPDEPFPRVNNVKEFKSRHNFYKSLIFIVLCGGVILSCLLAYGIAACFGYDINTRVQNWFLNM